MYNDLLVNVSPVPQLCWFSSPSPPKLGWDSANFLLTSSLLLVFSELPSLWHHPSCSHAYSSGCCCCWLIHPWDFLSNLLSSPSTSHSCAHPSTFPVGLKVFLGLFWNSWAMGVESVGFLFGSEKWFDLIVARDCGDALSRTKTRGTS